MWKKEKKRKKKKIKNGVKNQNFHIMKHVITRWPLKATRIVDKVQFTYMYVSVWDQRFLHVFNNHTVISLHSTLYTFYSMVR